MQSARLASQSDTCIYYIYVATCIWYIIWSSSGISIYTSSRSSSELSSLPFNQGHSADILQSYLKVSHKDFTNLNLLSFCKSSITSPECHGMEAQELEMQYNFAETKSKFAHASLMSLLGLHT